MTMFSNYPDILTVKQVGELLNIGRNGAYELIRTGKVHSVKIGRQIRISKDSLIEFVNSAKQF